MLTEQEKQQIIKSLERMDNIKAYAASIEGGFIIESTISILPVNRVSSKLARRGAKVESTGSPRRKLIIFDTTKLGR